MKEKQKPLEKMLDRLIDRMEKFGILATLGSAIIIPGTSLLLARRLHDGAPLSQLGAAAYTAASFGEMVKLIGYYTLASKLLY